ncbi:hypothetical protein [Arcobacter roscoffensis]|uniref:Highly acidic protein n=1 Tax=Arcobacter roscoffensis TaxID=2961520 RepID=A0ABY5E679_9BACT|nr:hypothetical protein [Arcobacter roscoffensis]UTJ06266.1 hypothetical protein NJU99_13575 [Arcobacter roscoffensis]
MNVYIYGNSGFKKEIHETLEHANIKFKLDANSIIKDINNLEELKTIIKNNPNDIYLIDDEKIIKKDGFSKKIKFLTPKDGIEEEFLLDNGIADLSVDSLKEIPKYIIEKYEQQKKTETQDIQNSIADIVDDAYNQEEENNKTEETKDNLDNSTDLDFSDDFELDAELASLLEKGEESAVEIIEEETPQDDKIEENFDFIDESDNLMSEKELENLMNFEDDMGLNNSSFDYDENSNNEDSELQNFEEELNNDENEIDSLINDLENDDIISQLDNELDFKPIEENIEEDHEDLEDLLSEDFLAKDESFTKDIDETIQGEKMSDEFSELDSLNENDILSAIENLDDVESINTKSLESQLPSSSNSSKNEQSIEVSSSSAQDIAELITKLLNNKTLEITIKIKD